ncbi:MAG: gliding motility-associated C-terminal domain-containing protein [Flavobacteriales bacterium]
MRGRYFLLLLLLFSISDSFAQYPKWILGNSQQTAGGSFYSMGPGNLAFHEVDFTTPIPTVTQRTLGASVNNIPSMGTLDVINNALDNNGNVMFYLFCATVVQYGSYGSAPSDTVYFVAYNPTTGADEVFGKVSGLNGMGSVIEHGFCQRPGVYGQYYFIYKTHLLSNTFDDVKYVVVDGINKTVSAPVTIVSGQKTGEGMAISQLNCALSNQYLFTTKLESNGHITLRTSEITNSGIGNTVNAYTVSVTGNTGSPVVGAVEVSPNNDLVAVCLYTTGSNKSVSILDFDPQTGVLNNERFYLNQAGHPMVACEFSPDGSRLYLMQGGSSGFPNEVFNCAVIASGSLNFNPAFLVSGITIAGSLTLECAYDGKIYVNKGHNASDMYCITNPNSATPTVGLTASPFFGGSTWRVGTGLPDQIDGSITVSSSTPFITGVPSSICTGQSATLTVTGATSIQWLAGTTGTSAVVTVSPTQTTTYVAQLITPCDTILDSLTIIVSTAVTINTSANICQGSSYILGTQTLTSTGNYTEVFPLPGGCDSVVNLTLSVSPVMTSQLNQQICSGQTYIYNGQTYSQAGVYTHVFTTGSGCDSTINLNLSVLPTYATPLSQQICSGDSVQLNGQFYFQTGLYTQTLIASNGCDSVLSLTLQVDPLFSDTLNYSICQGETLTIGSQTFSSTGIYPIVMQTANGCDSIVNINLYVIAVPQSGFVSNVIPCDLNVLFTPVDANNISYNWFFGDGAISSAVSPVHLYADTGDFSVTLIVNIGTTCADTTVQLIYMEEGYRTEIIPNVFSANRDGINDCFEIIDECVPLKVQVYDRWGVLMFEQEGTHICWDATFKNKPVSQGVYYYIVMQAGLPDRTGHVTVFR